MAIKYYKDGEWKIFPGTIGPAGKDAYQIAQENGYKGTREEFSSSLASIADLSEKVDKNTQDISAIDSSKFVTNESLESKNYLSEIPSIYITEDELSAKNFATKDDLKNVDVDLNGYATEQWVGDNYQIKGDYLTAIPDEYITSSELEAKDYATKSDLNRVTPDLSGVYTKSEIDAKGFITEIPTEYITETELSNKNYALKSDIPTDFYSKDEVDQKISEVQSGSADLANYYTKGESDGKYALKSDVPADYVSNSVFESYKTEVADSYYDTTETKRVIALTQDEYNALTDKDENALYFIVDSEGNLVTNTVDGDLTVTGSVEVGGNVKAQVLYENGVSLADKYLSVSSTSVFAPSNKYYSDVTNIGMPGICDLTATAIGSVDVDSIKVTKSEPSALIITNYESDVVFGSMYAKSFGSEDVNLTSGYKCYAITYVNDNLALVNFAHYV
jgi:hypothetical protein